MNRFIKRADILLIILAGFLCLTLFLPRYFTNRQVQAIIYKNGEEIYRIDLSKVKDNYTINLGCKPAVIIQVEHGAIRYLSSDCPDKLCVKTGRLTHNGDMAVCLPSKTAIIVKGDSKGELWPDILTY